MGGGGGGKTSWEGQAKSKNINILFLGDVLLHLLNLKLHQPFVRLQSEKDFDKNLPCRISIVGHKNRGREFKVFFLHFVAPRQIHQIFNFLNLSNDLI